MKNKDKNSTTISVGHTVKVRATVQGVLSGYFYCKVENVYDDEIRGLVINTHNRRQVFVNVKSSACEIVSGVDAADVFVQTN